MNVDVSPELMAIRQPSKLATYWKIPAGIRHAGAGVLSFADGHSEARRWRKGYLRTLSPCGQAFERSGLSVTRHSLSHNRRLSDQLPVTEQFSFRPEAGLCRPVTPWVSGVSELFHSPRGTPTGSSTAVRRPRWISTALSKQNRTKTTLDNPENWTDQKTNHRNSAKTKT